MKRWILKTQLGYQYVEGDVEWNPVNTLRYPAVCFFAGFFAGMFGIGGGIVKGPLMLEMGEGGGGVRLSARVRACVRVFVYLSVVFVAYDMGVS